MHSDDRDQVIKELTDLLDEVYVATSYRQKVLNTCPGSMTTFEKNLIHTMHKYDSVKAEYGLK